MSLTSYTYTKTITNLPLIMSYINNIYGNILNLYQYKPGVLTLNFSRALSTDENVGLNLLINNYVDSSVLTPSDVLAFKYISINKTLDQTITTGVNSVTTVLFQTTSYIDRWFYQISVDNTYIYIQRPGLYLIYCKVGATLGGTAGTDTVLQWSVGYDDTRSGIAYITIPNSSVYTCHSNVNNMTDSTTLCCFLNVTSATGTNIRTTCKVMSGTTPLLIDSDLITMNIMNIQNIGAYEGNLTTTTTLTTTPSVLNMSTDRISQYPFTHTAGTANITATVSGFIIILAKATFNKTSGTNASQGTISLRVNGTPLTNGSANTHVIFAPSQKTTCNLVYGTAVNAGDVISMQAQILLGTYLQVTGAETGLLMMYLQPVVLPSLTLGSFNSNGATNNLSTVPVEMTYNQTTAVFPSWAQSSYSTNSFTITTPGLYWITTSVSLNNPSTSAREGGVYIGVSVDGGKSFVYQNGTLAIKQLQPSSLTTVFAGALCQMPENSRFKIFASTNGTAADNITVGNNTTCNIVCFNQPTPIQGLGTFGDKFGVALASEDLYVSSPSWVERSRVIDHSLWAGIYRVGTSAAITCSAASTTVNVQVLAVNSTLGSVFSVYSKSIQYPSGTFMFSSVDYLTALQGSYALMLQFSSPNSVPFTVQSSCLEIWCVG